MRRYAALTALALCACASPVTSRSDASLYEDLAPRDAALGDGDERPTRDAPDLPDAPDAPDAPDDPVWTGLPCTDETDTYALCGRVTYDFVPARDNVSEGGVRLDYSAIAPRPARRVRVEAVSGETPVAQTNTRDDGTFVLRVPRGTSVTLRALAHSQTASYVPNSPSASRCNGASWDVSVTDNTLENAVYALEAPDPLAGHTERIALHAPLAFSTRYTRREAAPFAVLDTLVSSMERVCQGQPNIAFPTLEARWSVNNTNTGGDPRTGRIGTSYYSAAQSALYLLGREDVDTDEYDDHVVAHEFGHYLEDQLYRADGLGGDHPYGVLLDPRVAFAEGYGTAFACMVFDDPVYVDTNGAGQARGFTIRVSQPPEANDRGVYSERSVQRFLWQLFDARRLYTRIHEVLAGPQKSTRGFTSAVSFASHYNALFGGDAEGLRTQWTAAFDSPYDALCEGACAGEGDAADPVDSDDDLGSAYGSEGTAPRLLPRASGMRYPRAFWQLFRTLTDGENAPTAHEQTRLGGYAYLFNTLGAVRWYRYVGTGRSVSISVHYGSDTGPCARDDLDMDVRRAGVFVTNDRSRSGCPTVRFATTAGTEYALTVYALSGAREVSGYALRVEPKPHAADRSLAAPVAAASELRFGRLARDPRTGRRLELMRAQTERSGPAAAAGAPTAAR